jgi:hypothetical protein
MDKRSVTELMEDAKRARESFFNMNPEEFYGLDPESGKYYFLTYARNLPDTPEARAEVKRRADVLEELGDRRWKKTVGEHAITYRCLACGHDFGLERTFPPKHLESSFKQEDDHFVKKEKLIHDEICRSGITCETVYL